MNIRPIFFTLLSFLSTAPFAQAATIEIESKVPAREAPLLIAEFSDAITRTNALLGELTEPSEVKVTVGTLFIFSIFDPKDFTIYVGLRPDSMGKKHILINKSTLIHEYGHAILEKNLLQKIPDYRQRQEAADKVSESQRDSREILQASLHEIFADAVTILTTKNPKAIFEILHDRNISPKQYSAEHLLMRNLAEGRRHEAAQQWQKLLQNETMRRDPYFILLPARWHLWQLLKTRIDGTLYQKQALNKIFPLIANEVENLLLDSPESVTLEEIENLNHRLMSHLTKVL